MQTFPSFLIWQPGVGGEGQSLYACMRKHEWGCECARDTNGLCACDARGDTSARAMLAVMLVPT